MNNSIGDRAKKTEEFAEILRKRTNLEVILWDERLTTVSADNVLTEGGLSLKKKESVIDMIAAVFILQGYLDKLYNQKDNGKETERYE